MAAAAELILQKDWEAENMLEGQEESDEGFGGDEYDDEDDEEEEEEESEAEDETMRVDHPADQSLTDSGFGCVSGASPRPLSCESRYCLQVGGHGTLLVSMFVFTFKMWQYGGIGSKCSTVSSWWDGHHHITTHYYHH